MKKLTGFVVLLISNFCLSQDASIRQLQAESLRTFQNTASITTDSIPRAWKAGGLYSISLGQGTLSNWAGGGDDFSLSVATSINLFASYKKNKNSWDNALDMSFGYVKTSTLGGRKNDDRFDLLTKYGYALSPKLNLTTLGNFRSQFFRGYNYNNNSKTGTITKNFASAFLSPFVSPFTSRWLIVNDDSLAAKGDYGTIAPGKHSHNQLGAFATVNYHKAFNKYVSYRGRIDVFSNYKNNPANLDIYMTNTLSAKVAKIIAFNWNFDMIYDDDVQLFGKSGSSPALQLKSIIGVGLQVKI
jgi:hypothetical protein